MSLEQKKVKRSFVCDKCGGWLNVVEDEKVLIPFMHSFEFKRTHDGFVPATYTSKIVTSFKDLDGFIHFECPECDILYSFFWETEYLAPVKVIRDSDR